MTMSKKPRRRMSGGGASNRRLKSGSARSKGLWVRRQTGLSFTFTNPGNPSSQLDDILVPKLPLDGIIKNRQIRRISVTFAVVCRTNATSTSLINLGGVAEFQMGLAEESLDFVQAQQDADAPGLYRRKFSFTQGSGLAHFWIPGGFNQQSQAASATNGPLAVRYGFTAPGFSRYGNGVQYGFFGTVNWMEKELTDPSNAAQASARHEEMLEELQAEWDHRRSLLEVPALE